MTAPAIQKWGFFTYHALVMAYICERGDSTVRTISDAIGITERATLTMLGDLQQAGIVIRHRVGRSNTYTMDLERLAMFRRGNAGPPTPASFADALISTLLEISGSTGNDSVHPRPIDAGAFSGAEMPWGFFTNHLRTLLALANTVELTANEIAAAVGITERAAVAIKSPLGDVQLQRREVHQVGQVCGVAHDRVAQGTAAAAAAGAGAGARAAGGKLDGVQPPRGS